MTCQGCHGCVIYESTGGPSSCDIVNDKKQDLCPCKDCLVKVVCRSTCDLLWDLVERIERTKCYGVSVR